MAASAINKTIAGAAGQGSKRQRQRLPRQQHRNSNSNSNSSSNNNCNKMWQTQQGSKHSQHEQLIFHINDINTTSSHSQSPRIGIASSSGWLRRCSNCSNSNSNSNGNGNGNCNCSSYQQQQRTTADGQQSNWRKSAC
ncbi:hypothetical protein AWZ03_007609 [Drosophila navojoa]|uniref:Uncharacterized protein n=1 Tax=Drosophila navojoa TaxID=7232 RepID=A0A484BB27_DRONA|nr:hypothetical protein AWZ03_007609 [Drosophila navojoa]